MKAIKGLMISILILLSISSYSQCLNADFELGNFTGWQAWRGGCCPINTPNFGIVPGRHTITFGPGTDPFTCNVVPVVCPWGGNFSARLGNSNVNAQAEALSYTFVVTPNSTLFTYSYAVVFEDPGHIADEQPRFETSVIVNGSSIPCTDYMVSAASNLPGFQTCPGFDITGAPITRTFRNWSTVGVDLTPYIGQSVTVIFRTGDCDLGGHFGYAYIDAISCQPMEIEVNYCVDDTAAILTAPPGFSEYNWSTGDTTQTITIDPTQYNLVTCEIISFSGCVANLSSIINPADPQISFIANNPCLGTPVTIFNSSSSIHSPITSYQWSFGDGSTSNQQNPQYTYSSDGTYDISLIVQTEAGCSDTLVQEVIVHPTPTILVDSVEICLGESTELNAYGAVDYTWAPALWLNQTIGSSVISNPPSTITYTVTGTDQFGCVGVGTGTVTVDNPPSSTSPINHN
jgi:PKD repeat protein